MKKQLLRLIPAVHELQKHERFLCLLKHFNYDEKRLTVLLKQELQIIRERISKDSWNCAMPGTAEFNEEIFNRLQSEIENHYSFGLKRVINATGTVLHTNLGRSRLSQSAIEHMTAIAKGYSNLEYKLKEGDRGSRHTHLESWITKITGAEAAMVVNNNAAAVYLVLRALAKDKEVIVSRGQLIEIGGSFRISSIMEESEARLIEIGTTNKTHLKDYEQAISENTAVIMKVHTSNFKTVGFTKSVEATDLIALAAKREDILFYEDLGSGVLYDLAKFGVGEEPLVHNIIKEGADLISFSGDKLLGGPQAGIIAGRKKYIDKLKSHQLARVLRVDKITLAALEATLADYLKGETVRETIPTIRDILISPEQLQEKAASFLRQLEAVNIKAIVLEELSTIGGGTMPGVEMPTYAVAVIPVNQTVEELRTILRKGPTPIVTRAKQDMLLFDVRTITEEEMAEIVEILQTIY